VVQPAACFCAAAAEHFHTQNSHGDLFIVFLPGIARPGIPMPFLLFNSNKTLQHEINSKRDDGSFVAACTLFRPKFQSAGFLHGK